ncbi:hypothetical protein H0B56_02460 [Haloechinothrix sp. YIM 98757]|uniref:Uncharacterized protein n=1 Tax=Haloechinothrix aidingensis TaxID=2752311 RepID=A0A838A483_9PSEU|nr:hypothetical protein [Haloechinothrix aidingensis]MBA0124400.1 hypothetical protein [Haloechinothrix aidingensis]
MTAVATGVPGVLVTIVSGPDRLGMLGAGQITGLTLISTGVAAAALTALPWQPPRR